jgi:hypothetical protein
MKFKNQKMLFEKYFVKYNGILFTFAFAYDDFKSLMQNFGDWFKNLNTLERF